jgi:transposase
VARFTRSPSGSIDAITNWPDSGDHGTTGWLLSPDHEMARFRVSATAFNTKTGEVIGKTAARHTSAEFIAFLTDIVANQPVGKEIHVIVDNLSAHKTKRVDEFLAEHLNVHMHFTPTYSSWLNQVELWFAKIERDVIARGVFTSVPDLKRKLMRYIRQYNKQAKPVKWKYFDPSRRITTDSIVTVH